MAEPAYRIEQLGTWPRPCQGCGERMWNPRRWAHRRCALTLTRQPRCTAVGPYLHSVGVLTCKLPAHDGGWHEDASGASWIEREDSQYA